MKLQSLQLYDFRSYETASVQLHPGVNLIVGENAQGKTNLLESVFYLSTGKKLPHRPQSGADPLWRRICRFKLHSVFRRQRAEPARRAVFRQKAASALHRRREAAVCRRAFRCADDRSVLSGRSADLKKRLFRKTEDSRYRPVPAPARLRAGAGGISEAVRQQIKNFKRLSRRPFLLEPLPEFNYRMAQVGAVVIAYRAKFLRELSKQARLYHAEFSGGREELSLVYQTVSTVTDPFADKKRFFSSCSTTSRRITAPSWIPGSVCPARIRTILKRFSASVPSKPTARRARPARRLSVSSWPSANYSAPTPARSRFCCWTTCCPSWTHGGRILCSIRSVPGRCSSPAVSRNASRISANAFLWRADRSGRSRHVPEYRRRFFRPVGIRRGRV